MMRGRRKPLHAFLTAAAVLLLFALPVAASGPAGMVDQADQVAQVQTAGSSLAFEPLVGTAGATLTVAGPAGLVSRQDFKGAASIAFDTAGLADGTYRYELVLRPALDTDTLAALGTARKQGTEAEVGAALRASGKLPAEPAVLSGVFSIAGGALVPSDLLEKPAASAASTSGLASSTAGSLASATLATQVIAMDLIVQGSECVGIDCTSTETFGFDTIRMKENNTRVKFEDTSVGTFPTNDWQLTANDSASGGASKFSIEDIDHGRVPFTLTANAPTNSIFVDSSGRVGLGTSTPVLNLHIVKGDSPAIRLEQNGSSGFTPQTWDIAGNETNFFVRDVTNGSKLPFKIQPNAPTNSLTVHASDGNIGMGTVSPSQALHVIRAGTVRTQFEDSSSGVGWNQVFSSTNYRVKVVSSGSDQFILDTAGNLTVTGTVMGMSDRNSKENITPIDPETVLEKVAAIPISRWNYRTESPAVTHLGPMAQDFHAAFGLGANDRTLAMVDTDGVALAAIQGLYKKLEAKDSALAKVEQENADLAARLATIEKLLSQALAGQAKP